MDWLLGFMSSCLSILFAYHAPIVNNVHSFVLFCLFSSGQANEDSNCYTFDMRKLDHAVCIHKDHVSAVYALGLVVFGFCFLYLFFEVFAMEFMNIVFLSPKFLRRFLGFCSAASRFFAAV